MESLLVIMIELEQFCVCPRLELWDATVGRDTHYTVQQRGLG